MYICVTAASVQQYVFVPQQKKPFGALEWHGGQIHNIYLHLYIYIYGAGGGSLEGGKKKTVPKKNL